MSQGNFFSKGKMDKVMSPEQFDQIVEAIMAGKYSWACVLILRFAGYNPLHYIPYRTYNRLMKENRPTGRAGKVEIASSDREAQESNAGLEDLSRQQGLNRIPDLAGNS